MTLKELAQRLQAVVQMNEEAGWGERNDLPVYLRLQRKGRRKDRWYRIRLASSAMMKMGETTLMTVEAQEDDEANINP